MPGDQRFELGDQLGCGASRQLGVEPVLDGDQAQLLQPAGLGLARLDGEELAHRLAPPQPQRFPQRHAGVAITVAQQLGPAAASSSNRSASTCQASTHSR